MTQQGRRYVLQQLRYTRTRESNRVRASIRHLLTGEIKWNLAGQLCADPQVLPSWWPFWAETLKMQVRTTVRAARALAVEEGIEL